MEYRWGMLGSRLMGAAAALALVWLHAGAAHADDSIPPVPTPVGTLVVGETPDGSGIGIGLFGAGPTADLSPLGVALDPGGDPRLPDPTRPGDPTRAVWNLLPVVLGPAPGVCPAATRPPCPGCTVPAPAQAPAHGPPPAGPGQLTDAVLPGLDPVAFALAGVTGTGPVTPATPDAPAPVPVAAATQPRASPAGSPLASTGTPVVQALAALVLMAVGGCLTWARARA